jgi:hypothetical protein
MERSSTQSISIDVPAEAVLDLVADARALPRWAPAFARAVRSAGADHWLADTGEREVRMRVRVSREHGTVDFLLPGAEEGAFSRVIPTATGPSTSSRASSPTPCPTPRWPSRRRCWRSSCRRSGRCASTRGPARRPEGRQPRRGAPDRGGVHTRGRPGGPPRGARRAVRRAASGRARRRASPDLASSGGALGARVKPSRSVGSGCETRGQSRRRGFLPTPRWLDGVCDMQLNGSRQTSLTPGGRKTDSCPMRSAA